MADSQRKTANLFDATIEQGTITINGDVAADNRIRTKEYIDIDSEYITLSWNSEQNTEAFIMMYDANGDYVRGEGWVTSPATKQLLSAIKKIRIIWRYELQADISPSAITNTMLNTGSTPLPYEPYGWLHSLRKLGTATDTITTLPADLYADGNNATVGLVGNMQQSGTPTPQNPIQPSETGERTGNLFDSWAAVGVLTSTGTIDDSSLYANYRTTDYIPVEEGSYTFSLDNTVYEQYDNTSSRYAFYDEDKVFINYDISLLRPARFEWTFTAPSNAKYVRLTGRISDDNIMLNSGSQSLPYEPYGYKLDIKSANTTTPVYLGEVESTRKIKKLVLTGEENWRYSTSSQVHWIENVPNDYNNTLISRITTVCTHYRCIQNNTGFSGMVNGDLRLYAKEASPIAHELYIKDDTYTTAEDFKTYLAQQYAAGTPVTIWYVLATEETGIVNEPLRKIGNYADTVSGITIPTTAGADSFDVLTTLKPSEVSLAYTGWHDATVKEWDGSEWQ